MNWYRVTRADGSYSWVQAKDKSEASRLVRDPGEAIKLVKQVDESEVPASAKGGTPAPTTPTEPTSTKTPIYDIDLSRASVAEELPPATGEERFGAIETPPTSVAEDADTISYNKYLEYIKTHPSWPVPKDKNDWLLNRDYWESMGDYLDAGFTIREIEGYDRVAAYGEKYGDLEDDIPRDRADYLANIDKYQLQLEKWIQEAGSEGAGFTDEQIREWQDYTWHSRYRETGDSFFADMGDFFNNYDQAIQQLNMWRKRAGEAEVEQTESEEYTQWSREQTKYAAQERYGETPMYSENFTAWLNQQGQFSGALEKYVEGQYPSLRSQFEAQAGRLTGFPTREEARAEATRREAGFQSWLGGEVPGLKQEYWAQRPADRGERPYMQSPNVREYNW